jgi:hypothetical protein
MLAHDSIDERPVADFPLDERAPLGGPAMSVDEVIEHDQFEPRPRHGFGRLTSDVASASNDQNRHGSLT